MNTQRIGVYVDALNVTANGGYGLRYDILKKFALREGGECARLNVYLAYDAERAKDDTTYRTKTARFCDVLRDFEYKVIQRPILHYKDLESGESMAKASVDIEMATDLLVHASFLDKIILVTNDAAFAKVVRMIQDKGCRVEVIGFDNVAPELKQECDLFFSGFMIPGLLPFENGNGNEWGAIKSKVRGVCYDYSHSEGYGFMRFLTRIDKNLWITDSRSKESPYKTIFCHVSQFEPNFDTTFLPSRELIFEFELTENDKGLIAQRVSLVSAP